MRILLIEDDKKFAGAIKKSLVGEGYAVDCLYDGKSGERRILLCDKEYDLIILDWLLPEKDGLVVLKSIREEGIGNPVLMLTGKTEIADRVSGLESGADDYLTKPFSTQELSARIKALLRRPKVSLAPKLKAGDITLDPATRKVFCGQREVELTLKEFVLLEYLMRNPGRAISREQIFEHLWDFACDSMSNVVDVHVNHLRSKVTSHCRKNSRLLETVRGVGYRLNS